LHLRWRRALASLRRRFAPAAVPTIALIATVTARLRRPHVCPAATASLLASAATITLTAATVFSLPAAAIALASTTSATAAALLTAAAVPAGPALTLGCAFRRIDERGRKHHGRGEEQ
jgi:hypothetical protein